MNIIRKPMASFCVGDWVRWRQGAVELTGKVIASVPKGQSGAQHFLKLGGADAEFASPGHRTQESESYLVRVAGCNWTRAKVYWPLSRSLAHSHEVQEHEDAPEDVEGVAQ